MSFDTSFYHHLTNSFLGPDQALDVIPDGSGRLRMAKKGNYSGQLWKLVSLGEDRYALRTEYLGDGFSLDVLNDSPSDFPWLAVSGRSSGQAWTLTPLGDGTYKLTNDFTGPGQSLDTTGDTHKPILASGDNTGQRWTLTPAKRVASHVDIPGLVRNGSVQASEGPTDFELYERPEGVVRAVMVFVEFPDALGDTTDPSDVARHLLGNGTAQRLLSDQSHGRLTLDITVEAGLGWRKMDKDSSRYETHRFSPHRDYIAEAVQLFSSDVDFSEYSLVLIATPEKASLKGASSFTAPKGSGIPLQNGEVRLVVTFDGSSHEETYTTLLHEVGHLFGLPDLYPSGRGAEDSLAGCWSLMSDVFRATGFLGWHRHKNGWLHQSKKTYLANDTAGWSTTLHPLSNEHGLSMIVLPIDDSSKPSKVFVVELAQQIIGTNGKHWGEGVLLYTVDARIPSGSSPVTVIPNKVSDSPELGHLFEAPYKVGDKASKTEGPASLTLTVDQRFGSSYVVNIQFERR